uniref:Proline dehydrogenase n=1 Tax=Sinocyclocheilus grahami TaxID=75366 RepID=A0A672QY28_SINGR
MSLRKTLPAFGRATLDRSLVISTRHHRSVQALHPTKTNTEDESVDSREHAPYSNKISIDFEQTKGAYKSKDTLELLRSLVVFKLCSYDILVDKNKEIMDLSRKLLGQNMFEQFMKMTFYGQFVAGEDHQSIRPVVQKNQAYGVGAVLDYMLSCSSAPYIHKLPCSRLLQSIIGADHREKKFTAHRKFGDRREGVTSARTYFYADEAKCDQHMETFLKCIKASGNRPSIKADYFLAAKQGKDGVDVLEQKLDLEQLQTCLARLGAQGNIQSCFTEGRLHSSGMVDMLDWNRLIDERTKISDLLVVPNLQTGELEPLLSKFMEEEERQMKRMLQRLDVLAKHAVENGVRLMVDAEQTYFQPAISRLTVEMKRIFNRDKAVVFNTYQCYLKEAFDNVSMDVELSRREGWCFGAKLVRGAYMYQERSRAAEIGYDDPINPDYESTNRMYHRQKMFQILPCKFHFKIVFLFFLFCLLISPAQAGFPVYKYVPYGPVNEVIPYLSRRAQENRGIMKGVQMERELLWKELMRRLTSGEVFYTPAV